MKFFCKNLINVSLKYDKNVKKTKTQNLISKIVLSSLKNHLLFIIFINFYSIINIC